LNETVDDTNIKTSVAVLIHHPSQWTEALNACKALRASGASVALFCLGQAPLTVEAPPDDLRIECYTDTFQIGMDCLPLQVIAERLKQSDLVIPL